MITVGDLIEKTIDAVKKGLKEHYNIDMTGQDIMDLVWFWNNDVINTRCFKCSYAYTLYLIIKEHFDRKSLESCHVIYDMLCALSAFDKDHLRSMEVVYKLKNGEAI